MPAKAPAQLKKVALDLKLVKLQGENRSEQLPHVSSSES